MDIATDKRDNIHKLLQGQFSLSELSKVEYAIKQPIMKWEEEEKVVFGPGLLVETNKRALDRWRDYLLNINKSLRPGENNNKDKLFMLVALFYRELDREYCTFAKRYLGKIC